MKNLVDGRHGEWPGRVHYQKIPLNFPFGRALNALRSGFAPGDVSDKEHERLLGEEDGEHSSAADVWGCRSTKIETPRVMPRKSRDDFSEATRHHLARSVNYHCSKCGAPTAAPYSGGGKSITTGVAAHICAAAPRGPRYDPDMTPSQRRHYDNGIWLCAAHAPLVDQDWPRYSVEELKVMKRRAEAKAAADLEHAEQQARLEPVLDGQIEWHVPAVNEARPGFERLHHAVFRIGGTRKQRGRVYLDLDVGEPTPRRTQACMGEGTDYLAHELSALRPGQPYAVPAFTEISTTSKFWLDRRFVPEHPFWTEPAIATLSPGTYLTDQPFLDQVHRQPLPPGTYRLRVVAILGDVAHQRTFTSDWKEIHVVA